jgi:hypothetical protein
MAVPFTNVSGSATVGVAEYSLPGNTIVGVPTAQTTAVKDAYVWIDRSAMVAGTQINLVIYEKVNGGTQRVFDTYPMVGTGTIDVFGPFTLGEGYDITLKKIVGADTVIAWSTARGRRRCERRAVGRTDRPLHERGLSRDRSEVRARLARQSRSPAGASMRS